MNLIEFNLQDDQYHIPSANFTLEGTIPVKPNRNYTLRLRLNCIGDVQRIITINHSTGNNPDVSNDTGKPEGLAKPLLRYIAGTGIHFEGLQATTNIHTMNGRRLIVLGDTLGRFFNFSAFFSTGWLTLTMVETEGQYGVDKGHGNIRVKLKHLKQAFGASALLRLRWYAENDFGLSDPSEYSDTVSLSTAVDIVNSKDAINVADASLAPPGVQLLDNSDYLRLNGTDVRDWQRWSGVFSISANLQPINTGSVNVRLSTANHSLQWTSHLQYLATNLKRGRILPGQMYNLGVALRSIPVSFFGLELRAYIFPDNGSLAFSNIVNEFAKIPLDGVTPIYKVGGVAIQIKDVPSLIAENQWLCFFLSGFGTSLSTSQFLEWDRPMFNRGVAPVVWTPKESEEGADYTPTGLSNISDQIQYVGSRGGYTDAIGTGTFILPEM